MSPEPVVLQQRKGANMSKLPETAGTPAQVRGDIQHGRTGDKKRGFDPAAAPLETDDEAAGAPLTAEATREARTGQLGGASTDTSTEYADAMRPLSSREKPASSSQRLGLGFAIIGIVIVIGALIYAVGATPS
jgi:hypothetical protein